MTEIEIKVLWEDDRGEELELFDLFPELAKCDYNFKFSENPDFLLFRQTGNSKYLDYKCVRISMEPERMPTPFTDLKRVRF